MSSIDHPDEHASNDGGLSRRKMLLAASTLTAASTLISMPSSAGNSEGTGAYSNSAIAMMPPGKAIPASEQERISNIKIERAMLSGPREITKDATVVEMSPDGNHIILRQGTNDWVCFPGDENEIGNVPMSADPMGLRWMMDIRAKKPRPTNTDPGLIYMLWALRSTAIPIRSIEKVQLSRLVRTG